MFVIMHFSQVRKWLGDSACVELLKLGQFDLNFARDILRPPPLWYDLASESWKEALNDRGFSFAKLLWDVVLSGDEMQKMKLSALEFVGHLGQGSFGVCSRVRDKVSLASCWVGSTHGFDFL